jgi:hypothetical protein
MEERVKLHALERQGTTSRQLRYPSDSLDARERPPEPREAYKNAREVLEMVLRQMKKEGTPIPEPSKPEEITWHNEYEGYGGFVSLIEAWTENENDERNRSVRVNCTIPRWMKEYAEEEGLNFSAILQNGIRRQLHIEHVNR